MTLDDRLDEVYNDGVTGYAYATSMNKASLAILSDLLQIIGEDICTCGCNFGDGCLCKNDKRIRQELRQGVREYCE